MTCRHIAALGLLALAWAAPLAAQQQAAPRALLVSGQQRIAQAPPPPRWPQDPGDALYRSARQALNDGDNARAARLFQQIRQRHPNSRYTPDALYWEAFARYRLGSREELQTALGALDTQRQRYPRASTRGDADTLATRIQGELARRGDQQAAQRLENRADRTTQQQCPGEDSDAVAALNGLLHMGSDRALPLLRRVLARRDACAAPLREKAVFLVAQMNTPESEQLLMDLARNDASRQVREQAVFWMSQGGSERSLQFLQEIIEGSGDAEMKEKAVFALSQHSSPRAAALLRSYAERAGTPQKVREQAIFWLGQSGEAEDAEFLRGLFRRATDREIKEKLLFSLSQTEGGGRWLMEVAGDAQQPLEVRKQALFWAAQEAGAAELAGLYGRFRERELKEQVIFGLAQSSDRAAVDRLIEIARRDPDREMRQKAIFWLGQSSDPRATRVIEEMIEQ